jgi:hypothetical protein
MSKVDPGDDSLYDGILSLFSALFVEIKTCPTGLYGEEFEEDFAVSTLGNSSNLTDANGDDADAELLEPPEDDVTITLEQPQEEARPIPTLVDSRSRLSSDALPPKPSSAGNGNGGGSLSYSAQVAEQFSSAYRQTPSQERGRLDAARLAQFQVNQNQNQNAGAPSGSGSSTAAGEVRPIRPSEMKDEGCVLSFPPRSVSPCMLYVKGVSVYSRTVRQLLSGSLTHTRTKSPLHQMLRRACHSLRVFSFIFFRILLPTQDDLKKLTLLCSPLCRFTSPTPTTTTNPPLCICTLCRRLSPFPGTGTTPRHVLTARCLSAAYPGIQQMVLYLLLILPPFFCNVMSTLLTH